MIRCPYKEPQNEERNYCEKIREKTKKKVAVALDHGIVCFNLVKRGGSEVMLWKLTVSVFVILRNK